MKIKTKFHVGDYVYYIHLETSKQDRKICPNCKGETLEHWDMNFYKCSTCNNFYIMKPQWTVKKEKICIDEVEVHAISKLEKDSIDLEISYYGFVDGEHKLLEIDFNQDAVSHNIFKTKKEAQYQCDKKNI